METKIVLADERETELSLQARALLAEAKQFEIIRDDEHRDAGAAFMKRCDRGIGFAGALFDGPTSEANALHKSLCARRKALDGPFQAARAIPKGSIGVYENNYRATIEAQRRAEEAAARLEAERLERDRQGEIAAARKLAEDKRLADAAALEAAGKRAEADAVLDAPVFVVVPPVAAPQIVGRTPAYQAPEGMSTRVNWKARIVNVDLIPREWLIPNETAIGAHVRAHKDKHGIPGVEGYPEASVSLR